MKTILRKLAQGLLKRQYGYTLPELLLALGISSAIGTGLVTSIHQMTKITSHDSAKISVAADMRNTMEWLSRDIQMAKTTTLVDEALPVSAPVTLSWTDEFGGTTTSHSATYDLVGTDIRRTYDGATHTVGRNVTSVTFSLQGRLITVDLTSTDDKWADVSKQFTHYFYLRPSL